MDEETRRRREEQIKRLEELQAKYKDMLNERLQELSLRGRMNFFIFKRLVKWLLRRK